MDVHNPKSRQMSDLTARLLGWYDRHRRRLPWRAGPGETPDPYKVWISEIMLQQTTVAAVGPYFARFMERWPTPDALAGADLDEVLHAWQGLGYYARARNLHRCAKILKEDYAGRLPESEAELRKLPGIGEYTAAAIAAIAFDKPTLPVDGNVERVVARMEAVETPLPEAKKELKQLARRLTPSKRTGDFAQALFDLGATICTPKRPACAFCPWADACRAKAYGRQEDFPVQGPKKTKPRRHGIVFFLLSRDGHVLLRRRPEKGLLGGMMEVPSTVWREKTWSEDEALHEAPVNTTWKRVPGVVRHTFTHFHLELGILFAVTAVKDPKRGTWCALDRLDDQALPTVMKKVITHATAKV